ncbi:MAG: amidohydrolase family protein [Tepidisphaeraceae bacterium]
MNETPPNPPDARYLYRPTVHAVWPEDRELFEKHLRSFVPPDAFDAHAHCYTMSSLGFDSLRDVPDAQREVGMSVYRERTAAWMGDRCPGDGLFFGLPTSPAVDTAATNTFVAEQLQGASGSRALMLIRPDDEPDAVEAAVELHGFAGFKVYHAFASRHPTFDADLAEFLPDWAWEIAHRRGLAIMLHIVKPRALADPANQSALREALRKYGSAKLILAHAGRGFCAMHTVEGIPALGGLENVFFDTSAICEPGAFIAIAQQFGLGRLMFGTDFPVSNLRGRCSSLGDGFVWLYEHSVNWDESAFGKPTLVGIESLLALHQACRLLGSTDAEIERVFCTNVRELLGIRARMGREGQRR